jgi:hypothetical protein
MESPVPAWLQRVIDQNGYSEPKQMADGTWCALLPFNFTWGLVVGLTTDCYERRYCYERQVEAWESLRAWDGNEHPPGPWIKAKGVGLDLLNPLLAA